MDSNKEDSDQLLKDGDIALEAALENTRVSQDLFNPVFNWLDQLTCWTLTRKIVISYSKMVTLPWRQHLKTLG